jgi:carbon-monoxide dehydrogenase medium subunit
VRTFEYLKPTTVQEALDLLDRYGESARLIAGGTDAMVMWKKKEISPDYFISLRNVMDLNFIKVQGDLTIGSGATHRSLELSAEIRKHFPVIADAVGSLGSVQVRNSATIGGNICTAAPSADSAPPLLVLEAMVNIKGSKGSRSVPIDEFFAGPSKTVLEPGEIVTDFHIAQPLPNTGMAYWKHTRRKAMDLPILGVASLISFEDDLRTCKKVRIGLGVAAPTPMRAKNAEAFLEGKALDEGVLDEAGKIAAGEAQPRTSIRGSEWYRKELIGVLLKRVAVICQERAKGAGTK